MQLIVDSGATKALWAAVTDGKIIEQFSTPGISPYYLEDHEIITYARQVHKQLPEEPSAMFFYGTGCNAKEGVRRLTALFRSEFRTADPVEVDVDITGAARAACGRQAGITAILGTGSNACTFNGKKVTDHIGGLGYIIGDEGSGAALGKALLGAYFNRQLPESLQENLEHSFDMDRDAVLDNVYRNSTPSRYLARFALFLHRNQEDPFISALLRAEFGRFCRNNLLALKKSRRLPVHFIGSVAFHFRPHVEAALRECGLQPGNFLADPIEGLVKYHTDGA